MIWRSHVERPSPGGAFSTKRVTVSNASAKGDPARRTAGRRFYPLDLKIPNEAGVIAPAVRPNRVAIMAFPPSPADLQISLSGVYAPWCLDKSIKWRSLAIGPWSHCWETQLAYRNALAIERSLVGLQRLFLHPPGPLVGGTLAQRGLEALSVRMRPMRASTQRPSRASRTDRMQVVAHAAPARPVLPIS